MSYVIKYYRDEESSKRYRQFGGLDKPAGFQLGRTRHEKQNDAQTEMLHINSCGPKVPAVIVTV